MSPLIILATTVAVFAAVILGTFLHAAIKGLTFREAWQIWRESVEHEYREHPPWLTRLARWRKRRSARRHP